MDWKNPSTPSRRVQKVTSVTTALATASLPIVFVGDLTSVGFSLVLDPNNSATAFFDWFADPGGLVSLVTERVYFRAGAFGEGASWVMPVHGAYFRLRLQPIAADITYSFTMWSDPAGSYSYPGNNLNSPWIIIFNADAQSFAAGNTTLEGGAILPGLATFLGEATAANCFITLYAVDSANNQFLLSRHTQPNGNNEKLVNLPPMHLRLIVSNGSGVNQTFSYSLSAKPGVM